MTCNVCYKPIEDGKPHTYCNELSIKREVREETTPERLHARILFLEGAVKALIEKLGEQEAKQTTARARFVPPTLAQVAEWCKANGYQNTTQMEACFYHYEANGWKTTAGPIKNWQAAFHKWFRNVNQGTPRIARQQHTLNEMAEDLDRRLGL